ncbi:GntR family transcriptional regulator [Microbacterium betulae]|uniref:GntR family transcriptional regulator n=1 Tax=Microbacterium betulae TaxID=2981139 RepID=A0AA97FGH7_9MICO|nr:GntR family transcriptional regulator [Microbacterium sp. AB]WOF22555.1 GntR family transcriptional regulator [Microbacterium sp. AB]
MTAPKYRELADMLRKRIAQSPIGTSTPSERQLAEDTGVSRMTARRAIDELVKEGLLTREVGRGTFVARPTVSVPLQLTSFTEDMRARGHVPSSRLLHLGDVPANEQVATVFSIEVGAPVMLLSRLRMADGVPMAIERSHLRTDVFPGLDRYDFAEESLYRVLIEDYGVRFEAGEQVIRAGIVRDADAESLRVSKGAAVLELVRVSVSRGSVVEWTTSTYPASRFELSARIAPVTVQGSVPRSALRARD